MSRAIKSLVFSLAAGWLVVLAGCGGGKGTDAPVTAATASSDSAAASPSPSMSPTTSTSASGELDTSVAAAAAGEADQPRLFASIEARQLYRRMEANWTRMWMLLAKEQIQKSGLATLSADQDLGLNLCAASGWASLREWVATSTGFDPLHASLTLALYSELSGGFGKLSVGGKELYNEFRYNEGTPVRVTIALQAGQRYPLVFERHGYAAGGMLLEWQTVDGQLPRQKVPTLQLSPS